MLIRSVGVLYLLASAFLLAGAAGGGKQKESKSSLSAKALLDRFRRIDWDSRSVGENKDLSDKAWKIRIDVENRLIALGTSAVKPLVEVCSDPNPHVRTLAAYCLGCLSNRSAIPALMRVAGHDSYAPARLMAIEALGRLGAREATEVVQAAVKSDPSFHVQTAARWALPRVQKGEGIGDSLRRMAMRLYNPEQVARAVVGQPAPDFTLPDHEGKTVRLSDFRGKKNVVIVFLLADW